MPAVTARWTRYRIYVSHCPTCLPSDSVCLKLDTETFEYDNKWGDIIEEVPTWLLLRMGVRSAWKIKPLLFVFNVIVNRIWSRPLPYICLNESSVNVIRLRTVLSPRGSCLFMLWERSLWWMSGEKELSWRTYMHKTWIMKKSKTAWFPPNLLQWRCCSFWRL